MTWHRCVWFSVFFFFKQKTAYEMRISDWSSDVCSSDLMRARQLPAPLLQQAAAGGQAVTLPQTATPAERRAILGGLCLLMAAPLQIGRASCRESVCQYV